MMLLDTCVVSEVAKARADPRVARWFAQAPEDRLYLSVLTLGEIENGCARLDPGPRRRRLEAWLAALRRDFADRLLPIGDEVALAWGRLSAAARKAGRPIASIDGLIAATALHHGGAVVTRNEADFAPSGVPIVNPWRD